MSGQDPSAVPSPPEPPPDLRPGGSARTLASGIAPPGLGYAVLLLALLVPQLGSFTTHLPARPNANDAQLIVWILTWVQHALLTPGASIYDPNINFPAPIQLTGSDYFLSSQLLFTPLLWLTGNPVLATNLAALATYWLAALCCERLLRALGCPAGVAFVAGLWFALSSLQLPFNVHVLQYPIFLYPLLGLALLRMRERPDVRHMLRVAGTFALGTFASLYAAIMLGVVGLVWALRELAGAAGRRLRFVALGLAAVVLAVAPLVPVLLVYLQRAGHQSIKDPRGGGSQLMTLLLEPTTAINLMRLTPSAAVILGLSLVAIGACLLGERLARRVVPVALALVVVGDVLSGGVPPVLVGTLAEELFRFVRYTHRFSSVADFGTTLLLATALAQLVRVVPRVAGHAIVVAGLIVVVSDRGVALGGGKPIEAAALTRDRAVHRAIGALADAHGRGPMLVLPTYGSMGEPRPRALEPDAMLASTLHWLPLINGYTGHQPAHRLLLLRLIHALPDRGSLDDLIDLTHLRWIVLRPESSWPEARQRKTMESHLRASPSIAGVWEIDGWTVLQVGRAPQHPSWFAAVARGTGPDTTVLGTPLTPLPAGTDVGVVEATAPIPASLPAKQPYWATIATTNRGAATWPIAPAPVPGLILDLAVGGEMPRRGSVFLTERWRPLDGRPDAAETRELRLRRDVAPGERIEQKVLLLTPEKPGRYRLELALEQADGARFDGPGNVRVHHDMVVLPPTPQPAASPRARR